MTKTEQANFEKELKENQIEINKVQVMLRKNKNLFNDKEFMEKRLKLFYKSYCIDCTLRGQWAASFNKYASGE